MRHLKILWDIVGHPRIQTGCLKPHMFFQELFRVPNSCYCWSGLYWWFRALLTTIAGVIPLHCTTSPAIPGASCLTQYKIHWLVIIIPPITQPHDAFRPKLVGIRWYVPTVAQFSCKYWGPPCLMRPRKSLWPLPRRIVLKENGPVETVSFPVEHGGSFQFAMLVITRG